MEAIRTPLKLRRPFKEAADTAGPVAFGMVEFMKLLEEIKSAHTQALDFIEEARQAGEESKKEHQKRIDSMGVSFDRAMEALVGRAKELSLINKGDKGDKPIAGVDFHIPKQVDEGALEKRILSKVPKVIPQVIDEDKIARRAARLVPKPSSPKVPTADEILEQFFTLVTTGKRKINVKHLEGFNEGLEQTMAPIRHLAAGFRGGGDTVAAGTNVTLTILPSGKVQINAAGGGGFTPLNSTETPNGVRTVFTFSAATAQPSYIISDNVWMKPVTKAGTVNWTWNAGTKQATMTIPPADDIEGIV